MRFTAYSVNDTQAGDYTAQIKWGDGTTSQGSIFSRSGNFTVHGGHTYLASGNYTVTVLITDNDGSTARAVDEPRVCPSVPGDN